MLFPIGDCIVLPTELYVVQGSVIHPVFVSFLAPWASANGHAGTSLRVASVCVCVCVRVFCGLQKPHSMMQHNLTPCQ